MNDANATPQQQNAPILVFSDDAGNQINEISLAPGEQKKITVVLSDHPEAITQNFLAQWSVYDSNHQLTNGISCVMDSDGKKWLNPLCLSTTNDSVGGMSGNDLNSARVSNGVWRCMGKNPNGQFWYPRDMYIPPVPVAEFVLIASSDWKDKYATFELDNNVTKFVMTSEIGTPAANGNTVTCNYSMKLTVNNAKADNVTPPQENNSQTTPPPTPPQDNGGETTPPPQEGNGGDKAPDGPITTFEGKPLVSKVKLDIAIETKGIHTIDDLKVVFIYNTFLLKKEANSNFVKVPGRIHVISEKTYAGPRLRHDIRDLPLEEGEYLEDASIAMVAYYRLGLGSPWLLCPNCYGLLDASSGKIDLIFDGIIFDEKKRAFIAKKSPTQIIGKLPDSIIDEVKKQQEEALKLQKERKEKQEQERREKEEQERREKEEQERREREEQKRKEKEEQERREREEQERKKNEINDFVNRCPVFSVEDGFASPPKIHQNANDAGVWVRGFRESKKGTWFIIDDNVNNQYIYPGNIILVDKDKKFTQNMVQIPFEASERKPLRLDARYSSEIQNGSTTLNSFTRADVNNFVSQCLTTFKNSGHDLASNTNWQYESSKRTEGITLGGTIEGIKFSGSAFQSNKTVAVAYLKQEMYTISVNNEYSYASDLFTDKVDTEKFRRNIMINSNDVATPAIIDAVKYGRIISLWVVQEGNEPASLNVDDYFNVTVNNTNKSTKYHLHVFGGIAGTQSTETDSLENVQNVLKQFKEVNKTAMETAMAIEYSVRFLRNLTTNVEWKVLPYYKTYLPRIKFKVTENNKGASMKCAVYMLNYQMAGNQYKYVKTQVDKKGVDYECYCSPKALCIDVKIDVTSGPDSHDFNVMLPCIPYDRLEPDENGEWVFKVNISGRTIGNKEAQCIPSLPGAILSTSNQIYMNNPKINGAPLFKYGNITDDTEMTILNYYIEWARGLAFYNKHVKFLYDINDFHDLRPDYD